MDALLVVDMQTGLLKGAPKRDLAGVLERINRLSQAVRGRGGRVIFIQHCGPAGDDFEPGAAGWALLPELQRDPADLTVRKSLNDPFAGTDLAARLNDIKPDRVLVTGWPPISASTPRCGRPSPIITTSSWSATHTLSDRPHLDAARVIAHHHWVWSELITQRSIRFATTDELLT